MRNALAAIVGVGRTKFGEHWSISPERMIMDAGLNAIVSVEKGIGRRDVQAFYVGSLILGRTTNMATLGAYLSRELSVDVPIISFTSSSTALYNAIRSEFDVVVVGGLEKMTDAYVSINELLSSTIDLFEADAGFSLTGLFATVMNRYIHEHKAKRESFAKIACKNHHHAANNENAHFTGKLSVERVLSSPLVADPIRFLECAPASDGAAALIITKPEIAKKYTDNPVYIIGSGQATDHISMYSRGELTRMKSTTNATQRALSAAKISLGEIQLAEVHDGTTIEEVLFLEDGGLAGQGDGWKVVDESIDSFGGSSHIPYHLSGGHELVVNAGGGLKADGHPIGATGARQVAELYTQLRGEAGRHQVSLDSDLQAGIAQDIEGSGSVATVHILRR